MQRMPSRAEVMALREQYKVGTRLELVSSDDPYAQLMAGDRGTVEGVDDAGQIMVKWDRGGYLSLIPGVDTFRRADK